MMGIFHGGCGWFLGAVINKFGENRDVIVELGFNGNSLDLLELSKRAAFG